MSKAYPSVTLIRDDSLKALAQLEDSSVDLILADLPYGTTQCSWDSVIPLAPLWEQYLRIAKQNAAIVLCAAQPFTSMLVASKPDLFRYEWIWEKGNATGFLNAKKQPLRSHESALVFYRRQPVYNPQMTSGHARKKSTRAQSSEVYGQAGEVTSYDSTDRYPRTVQFFSSDKQKSSYHPTQKPVAWMEFLVRTYTNPGMLVLDNTCGSGSSGVAAMICGCDYIGIDKDCGEDGEPLGYLDIASRRIFEARQDASHVAHTLHRATSPGLPEGRSASAQEVQP